MCCSATGNTLRKVEGLDYCWRGKSAIEWSRIGCWCIGLCWEKARLPRNCGALAFSRRKDKLRNEEKGGWRRRCFSTFEAGGNKWLGPTLQRDDSTPPSPSSNLPTSPTPTVDLISKVQLTIISFPCLPKQIGSTSSPDCIGRN